MLRRFILPVNRFSHFSSGLVGAEIRASGSRSARNFNSSRLLKNVAETPKGAANAKEARKARMQMQKKRAEELATLEAAAGDAGGADKVVESVLSNGQKTFMGCLAVLLGVMTFVSNEVATKPEGSVTKAYRGSIVESVFDWVHGNTIGRFNDVFLPYNADQIPRFESGPIYGEVPPWAEAPPLLVLDVEKTLIGSVHDTKYGWRHVKRPGVKKLIDGLTKYGYYEIVLFSENYDSDEIFMSLDPDGKCHKLSGHDAEERDGMRLKRLDLMNRNLGRIVLIDDDENSAQLFPRNSLIIKPFENVNDTTDDSLMQLLGLLQGLQHDGVKDFRDAFDDLGTHEVEEAVTEYRMRVVEAKNKEKGKRTKGLGSLIRRNTQESDSDEYFSDRPSLLSQVIVTDGSSGPSKSQLAKSTQLDLAGVGAGSITGKGSGSDKDNSKKAAKKNKGGLWEWLDESNKESEEIKKIKTQKINERYAEIEAAKQAKASASNT